MPYRWRRRIIDPLRHETPKLKQRNSNYRWSQGLYFIDVNRLPILHKALAECMSFMALRHDVNNPDIVQVSGLSPELLQFEPTQRRVDQRCP